MILRLGSRLRIPTTSNDSSVKDIKTYRMRGHLIIQNPTKKCLVLYRFVGAVQNPFESQLFTRLLEVKKLTLKIIVPVKQVPEVADVKVDEKTGTLIRDGVPSILNPFCEYAVEAAIQLREKYGGEVTIITMGPPQAKEALLKALAMGGDKAIHMTDRAFAGADTWVTALTLAEQIKKMEFDIVICGKQAIDGDTAQVGPEIAELLSVPQICYVRHLELSEDEKFVIAHRETDEGYDVVRAKIPVLLTATKGLNEPRLPNIMGIMQAKKKPMEEVNAETLGYDVDKLGLKGSPTQVRKVFPPEKKKGGIKIDAEDPKAAAKELVEFLAKKGAI